MTGPLYAAAERYARGEISREEIILTFTSWHYVAAETRTAGLHDDLLNFVPGSFDDVQAALVDGLIDHGIYSAALGALRAQTTAREV